MSVTNGGATTVFQCRWRCPLTDTNMEKPSQLEHECEMPLGFSQFTATSPRAGWPLRCVMHKKPCVRELSIPGNYTTVCAQYTGVLLVNTSAKENSLALTRTINIENCANIPPPA